MEDDESRQLKEVLRETGSRRRHRTGSTSSSSSSTTHSRSSSQENIYPTLSQPSSASTAQPATSSAPFTGGWKPASSPLAGAPIAQPVNRQPSISDDKDYVIVDDDNSPQSAELSQILRRQSLTKTTMTPSSNGSVAPPPPLGQRLSGDMRYAQQLQEEEEKLVRREEEDRKRVAELARQEENDRKFAELLQQREEFEAAHPTSNDADEHHFTPYTEPTRSRPTSRPTSSSTSGWSASVGPFSISVVAGTGSQERMFNVEEMRMRLLRQMQHNMAFHNHLNSLDTADEYDDDMHRHGRFRGSGASPFFAHHGFPNSMFHSQPDVDNMSYEELLELSERMGQVKQKGMGAEQLSVLPTWRWKGPVTGGDSSRRHDEKDEKRSGEGGDDTSCSICLTPYETGEEIKRLPCMRQFTTHYSLSLNDTRDSAC